MGKMTQTIAFGSHYNYEAYLEGRAEKNIDRKWLELNREEDQRCRWIEFEVETAELTMGSEKQKAWAEDIRGRTLTNYAESLYNTMWKNRIFCDKEKADELFAEASKRWNTEITSLSDMVEYRVKHDKLSVALINATDTKKIIDVYADFKHISKGNVKQL